MSKIPLDFYLGEDVLSISKTLLGKQLFTCIDGEVTSGIIVETEAYRGAEDMASHAYGNKNTPRTQVMFQEGGIAYIYLCYGIHYLFNIVVNKKNVPHAILIRALEPVAGIETMMHRRKKSKLDFTLTSGPGALSLAMGITKKQNGILLTGNEIWLDDDGTSVAEQDIVARPRVGVAYAREHALLPWRYSIKGNKWVSKAK